MAQSIEDMRKKIMLASNRKIVRRQMELLAESSRTQYYSSRPIPESSEAMVSVHKELIKAEGIILMRIFVAFFAFA